MQYIINVIHNIINATNAFKNAFDIILSWNISFSLGHIFRYTFEIYFMVMVILIATVNVNSRSDLLEGLIKKNG